MYLPLITVEHGEGRIVAATLDQLREAGVSKAAILDAVKAACRAEIDRAAELARQAVLTPGIGQAMEYQEAQAQAQQALASAESGAKLDPAAFPMLAASIGIDVDPDTGNPAGDVMGVARAVQAAKRAWELYGAGIRAARLNGKATVDEATDIDAACAAVDAVVWPAI